jgi:hypothetical protein
VVTRNLFFGKLKCDFFKCVGLEGNGIGNVILRTGTPTTLEIDSLEKSLTVQTAFRRLAGLDHNLGESESSQDQNPIL